MRRDAGSCAGTVRANHRTQVTKGTHLGSNVHFNGMTVAGRGEVSIGDNFHSGTDCLIITSNHDYDHGNAIPYGDAHVVKRVTIGDNVWFGSRVTILPGVDIGEGAIVQAGAVVVGDVSACEIVGGNPATAFAHRDIDHYERLKEQGRFH